MSLAEELSKCSWGDLTESELIESCVELSTEVGRLRAALQWIKTEVEDEDAVRVSSRALQGLSPLPSDEAPKDMRLTQELKAQSDAGLHYDDCDCSACTPEKQ